MLLYVMHSNAEDYSLAYSKKLGVEVLASGNQASWCSKNPQLTLIADKKSFFENDKAGALLKKIGQGVIEKKCPQALSVSIIGKGKGVAIQELAGSANKVDGWKLIKQVASKKSDSLQAETQATQLEKKTNAITKAEKKPVKLFTVSGWRPQPESGLTVYAPAKFLEVFNEDKTCKIRLMSKPYKGFDGFYSHDGSTKGSCVNGFFEGGGISLYTIRSGKKRLYRAVNAHFINGVPFSGTQLLEKPLLEYFQTKGDRPRTYLSYYLGSDKKLKVHYIGLIDINTNYRTVNFCNRHGRSPQFLIVTENEELFESSETEGKVFMQAASYIRGVCPGATMHITGTFNHQSLDQVYYYARVSYDSEKEEPHWHQYNNYAKQRKEQRIKEANDFYSKFSSRDFKTRLTDLHGEGEITNPLRDVLLRMSTEALMPVTYFARVSDVDGDSAETDWPVEMKISNAHDVIESPGWYVFSGVLHEEDEIDLNSKGYPIGSFFVTRATACKQEACEEANDVTQLIRSKFKLPDWEPQSEQGRK